MSAKKEKPPAEAGTPAEMEAAKLEAIKRLLEATHGAGDPAALFSALNLGGDSALDHLKTMERPRNHGKSTAAHIVYYSPNDLLSNEEEWRRLQGDERARYPRVFQNERVRLRLSWIGVNREANKVPRDQAELWEVEVSDLVERRDQFGAVTTEYRLAPDTQRFAWRNDADSHYNKLLLRFTESKMVDDKIVEVGNQLNPDKPKSVPLDASGLEDDVGAW